MPCLASMSSFVVVSSLKAPTSVGLPVSVNFNQLRDRYFLHTLGLTLPGQVTSVSLQTWIKFCEAGTPISVMFGLHFMLIWFLKPAIFLTLI